MGLIGAALANRLISFGDQLLLYVKNLLRLVVAEIASVPTARRLLSGS